MSANSGNIKKEILEAEVFRPQSEDFKVFFADDMVEVKAMLSDGTIIPFAAGGGDGNIYANDGALAGNRILTMNNKTLDFVGSLMSVKIDVFGIWSITDGVDILGSLIIANEASIGTNTDANYMAYVFNGGGLNNFTYLLNDPAGVNSRFGVHTKTPTSELDVNGDARIRGLGAGNVESDANGNLSIGGGGGGETFAQTLVLGNATGATDISIDSGQSIVYNVGLGGSLVSASTTVGAKTWTLPNATGTLVLGSGADDFTARWSGGALTQGFLRDNGTAISAGVAPSATDAFRIRAQAGDTNVIKAENTIVGVTTFGILALNSGASTISIGASLEAYATGGGGGVSVGARMLSMGVCTFPAGFTAIGGVGYADVNTGDIGDSLGMFACSDGSHVNDNYGLIIEAVNAGAGSAFIGKFTDGTEGVDKVLTSDVNGVATWQDITTYDTAEVYTPTNVITDRAYDADATTLDEIADVLGTLIADLKAVNILS